MEFKELKKKSEADLHKILSETREKLRDLRFKDANKQLKDVREIRKTRQVISQILTLLNKKEKTEESENANAGDNPASVSAQPGGPAAEKTTPDNKSSEKN